VDLGKGARLKTFFEFVYEMTYSDAPCALF